MKRKILSYLFLILISFNLLAFNTNSPQQYSNDILLSKNEYFTINISNYDKGILILTLSNDISSAYINYDIGLGSFFNDLIFSSQSVIIPIQNSQFSKIQLLEPQYDHSHKGYRIIDYFEIPNYLLDYLDSSNYRFLNPNFFVNYSQDGSIEMFIKSLSINKNFGYNDMSSIFLSISQYMNYNTDISSITNNNADKIFSKQEGSCEEYAIITAAIFRKLGYPTKLIIGYVSEEGELFGHSWNEIYLDKEWQAIDVLNYHGFIPKNQIENYTKVLEY